jgi:hypothetical protein
MPLLNFRSEIAHALLKAGEPVVRKRRRPSSDSPTPGGVKKQARLISKPVDDVKYDNIVHWPGHCENK